MKNQRQGVRSTKIKIPAPSTTQQLTTPTENDLMVDIHDTQETMYTDQKGKFPHLSSQGNRYQMILYHVASNSIWVEAMKKTEQKERS